MPKINISVATEADKAEVADFVLSHPEGQIEHTWEGCGLLSAASGGRWQTALGVARLEGTIVGVAPVAWARVARLPVRLARSEGGVLVAASASPSILSEMLQWVLAQARNRRCFRLELRLLFPERTGDEEAPGADVLAEAIAGAGFTRRSADRKGSYWLALDDDDKMLAGLGRKCRRDVRKGLREGVTVDASSSAEQLKTFQEHYLRMCERKSLSAQQEQYFSVGVRPCLEAGLAKVFSCRYEGRICNMALVTMTGRPSYWLGATTPAAFEKGTPPTGQTLHFGIMQHLRDLGRRIYDLGGSPGPIPHRDHPNYGVWKFKQEFGGPFVEYLSWYELGLSPITDRIVRLGQKLLRRRGAPEPTGPRTPGAPGG